MKKENFLIIFGGIVLLFIFLYGGGFIGAISGGTTLGVTNVSVNSQQQYLVTMSVNGGSDSTQAYISEQVNAKLAPANQITNSVLIRYQLRKENCGYKASMYSVPKLKRVELVKKYDSFVGLVAEPINVFDCVNRSSTAFYVSDWFGKYCYDLVDVYSVNYLYSPFLEAEVGIIASNNYGSRGFAVVSNTVKSADLKNEAGTSIGRVDWAGTLLNTNLCDSGAAWYAVKKDATWRLVDKAKVDRAITSQLSFKNSLLAFAPLSAISNVSYYGPQVLSLIQLHNNAVDAATESINLNSYNQIVEATGTEFKLEKEDMFAPIITLTLNKDFVGVNVVRESGKPQLSACTLEKSQFYVDSVNYFIATLKNVGAQTGSFSVTLNCTNNITGGSKDYGQIAPNSTVSVKIPISGSNAGATTCIATARDRDATVAVATCSVSGSLVVPKLIPTCTPPLEYNPVTNNCECLLTAPSGYYVNYSNCQLVKIPEKCLLQPSANEELINPDSSACYLKCKDGYIYEFNVCVFEKVSVETKKEETHSCPLFYHWVEKQEYNITFWGAQIPILSELGGKTIIGKCEFDWNFGIMSILLVVIGLAALSYKKTKKRRK